jgi:hypothetical protein
MGFWGFGEQYVTERRTSKKPFTYCFDNARSHPQQRLRILNSTVFKPDWSGPSWGHGEHPLIEITTQSLDAQTLHFSAWVRGPSRGAGGTPKERDRTQNELSILGEIRRVARRVTARKPKLTIGGTIGARASQGLRGTPKVKRATLGVISACGRGVAGKTEERHRTGKTKAWG